MSDRVQEVDSVVVLLMTNDLRVKVCLIPLFHMQTQQYFYLLPVVNSILLLNVNCLFYIECSVDVYFRLSEKKVIYNLYQT